MLDHFDDTRSEILPKLLSSLRLHAEPYAEDIELLCQPYLKPAPVGMYIFNQLEPAIVPERQYFTHQAAEVTLNVKTPVRPGFIAEKTGIHVLTRCVPLLDITSNKRNVFDENDRLVVPQHLLHSPAHFGNKSFLPYRGLKLVCLAMHEHILSMTSWQKYRVDYRAKIQDHLQFAVPPTDELIEEIINKIDTVLRELRNEVFKFVGPDEDNIYNARLDNSELVLEKYIDWRAYDWQLRMESAQWTP